MVSRRQFVSLVGRAGAGVGVARPKAWMARGPAFGPGALRAVIDAASVAGDRSPDRVALDESYWATIRSAFALDPSLIYLNSAGCSPTPRDVLDGMIRELRYSNEAPVQYMWRELEPRVEMVRRALAAEFGCDPDEIAVTRNASEANQIAILGLDLRAGDEVIVTTHNYDRMLTTWDQRADREGVVVRRVALEMPPHSDDDVVARIGAAITSRTRVIELPQLTNWTGQPLPIPAIVSLARSRGVTVIVDGAQGFAHIPTRRDELACDYYGASLHKWLLAPVGTGFLYVRRDQIDHLWPLTPAPSTMRGTSASSKRSGRILPPTTTQSSPRWRFIRGLAARANSPDCGICGIDGHARCSPKASACGSARRWTTRAVARLPCWRSTDSIQSTSITGCGLSFGW